MKKQNYFRLSKWEELLNGITCYKRVAIELNLTVSMFCLNWFLSYTVWSYQRHLTLPKMGYINLDMSVITAVDKVQLPIHEAYQISSSVSLHHSPPVITRIKPYILRLRTNRSGVKQYFCTLKNHSSSSLREPLIPAYCFRKKKYFRLLFIQLLRTKIKIQGHFLLFFCEAETHYQWGILWALFYNYASRVYQTINRFNQNPIISMLELR